MRYIRSLTSLSLLFAWLLADRINRYGPDCRGGMFSGIFRRHLSVVWFSDFVGLLPNCGEFRIISPERIHAATVIFGDTNPLYAIFQVSGRVMTVLRIRRLRASLSYFIASCLRYSGDCPGKIISSSSRAYNFRRSGRRKTGRFASPRRPLFFRPAAP